MQANKPIKPLLSIRQLRGGYGSVEILRGIDIDVGEIVALLGSNGAGKSP
jgi:branched-chain amino acid transport system ATP-binding protein